MESGLPVTLIVKAPNQQVADQTVTCEPSWTIGRLKGHLEEVYPCRPKSEEQKLIYSGRLLSDSVVLKDVLRKYEGQDTHTVHLVCTPPQLKYGRARQQAAPASQQRPPQSQSAPPRNEPSPTPAPPSPPVVDAESSGDDGTQSDREQMAAWSDQLNQWATAAVGNLMVAPGTGATPPDPGMMMFGAQMVWMQHMQMQQYYNMAGFPNNQPYPLNPQGPVLQPTENIREDRDVPPMIVREEPVVNNNLNNNNNDPDEQNRDWADWLYNMSRWVLIFSIVYFYSNPVRFFTVFVLGSMIYMFQMRVNIEAAHNEQRRDNADNINNNYRPRINNNDDEPDQNRDGDATDPPERNPESRDAAPAPVAEVSEESLLSITWQVFTSFFSSLIPEAPNARN